MIPAYSPFSAEAGQEDKGRPTKGLVSKWFGESKIKVCYYISIGQKKNEQSPEQSRMIGKFEGRSLDLLFSLTPIYVLQ